MEGEDLMTKGLLIFDFDDTLVSTNSVFDQSKSTFRKIITDLELDVPNLLEIVNNYDKQLVKEKGFINKCFPLSLVKTYHHCCSHHGRSLLPEIESRIWNVGHWVFEQPLQVKDGVQEVLHLLQRHYLLVLLTKGETEHQTNKVKESGLDKFFEEIFVVDNKDVLLFQKMVQQFGMESSKTWSIGNSIKSDINPALMAGINAMLVNAPTWDFEIDTLISPVPELRHIRELLPLLSVEGKELDL